MIRPPRADDRGPLRALLEETGVFSGEEVGIALDLIDVATGPREQADYIVRVYEEGGEVLGYYCVGPTPATEGTFDLYWIAVHPRAYSRGVGKALDEHATALVGGRGGRLLVAETSSRAQYDGTRRFYLARGYAEVARVPRYYRPDDDLVIFAKYLS